MPRGIPPPPTPAYGPFKEIVQLREENAALRERIDSHVMLTSDDYATLHADRTKVAVQAKEIAALKAECERLRDQIAAYKKNEPVQRRHKYERDFFLKDADKEATRAKCTEVALSEANREIADLKTYVTKLRGGQEPDPEQWRGIDDARARETLGEALEKLNSEAEETVAMYGNALHDGKDCGECVPCEARILLEERREKEGGG
jgi:hypothetical protein